MDHKDDYTIWAKVQLFGHRTLYGKVQQAPIGDLILINVFESTDEEKPVHSEMVGPKAIYSIVPVEKQICIGMARQQREVPISEYQIKRLLGKAGDDFNHDDDLFGEGD